MCISWLSKSSAPFCLNGTEAREVPCLSSLLRAAPASGGAAFQATVTGALVPGGQAQGRGSSAPSLTRSIACGVKGTDGPQPLCVLPSCRASAASATWEQDPRGRAERRKCHTLLPRPDPKFPDKNPSLQEVEVPPPTVCGAPTLSS